MELEAGFLGNEYEAVLKRPRLASSLVSALELVSTRALSSVQAIVNVHRAGRKT